ncbi:MAG: hypothetical protein A3G49_05110 [Candidatus Sungbacteria bacterium RIFCSPLOWO2_12_FULL_41_11]|uniref:Uncharacterized protein n=1 Tax=Candidatus Sungbacteria bacterium RIFCSPLOWO2_12_FULL_41_11 TaxID=1802286 RepID=A0A1G2LRK2_9BACT|nr:MAG: hypothetical protein A3D41_05800 [Candidatus Sungbacteria bacterium RIFCSPHIGHO2_02_FULL_41_12b]OHA14270.1 MAG: hypothetical protein A3G49_05110 [Candidatus Sungbacteria bacterium RIFCSPLOWO2_12_FULL_41_11]
MFKEGVTEEQVKQFVVSYGFAGHCLNPYGEWKGKNLLFFIKVPDKEEVKWVIEFKQRQDVVKDAILNTPV